MRYLLFLFLCLFSVARAQTGSVKGFVYDKRSSEVLPYTVVYLEGTAYGAQTDLNGYYSIPQVPAGTYSVATSSLGYDTARAQVTIVADQVATQSLYLSTLGIQLREARVSATQQEQLTRIKAGVTTITPRDMKLLPSTGGEPDIAQFLQMTPGVVFTGDQGGQLYLRGGSPTQTLILLDGVTIYNPFHSIGLYSVFETEAIRSADVQTAGFGAEYGNRTSAVLDIRTRDGNKNRFSGRFSASPIMVRGLFEGPIVKPKTEGGGSTTFLLSVKHSYLEQTAKSFYGGFGEPFESGLPYTFTDLFGKVTLSASNGSKLNVFGFNFLDNARVLNPQTDATVADFNWRASGGGATFVVTPGGSAALISGRFAYSDYAIDYNEANFRPRSSGIDGFESAINFTYFLPKFSQLQYGVEVSGFHTDLDYANRGGAVTTLNRRNTLASLFVTYRKNFAQKFVLEPGLRVQYYSAINVISPEPRLGVKYNLTPSIRLKAAAGYYTQNLMSTKSDRDIVNFFTGFLLSPSQQIQDEDGANVDANILAAVHGVAGLEVDINRVSINLEPWYKRFTRAIELNRAKARSSDPDYAAGRGEAHGVDLLVRYNLRRVYFWGTASYQAVTNTFQVPVSFTPSGVLTEQQTYATPFDRRLNLNLLGAYTAGKARDWEISLRYNLGSPFPFTQTQGFFEDLNLTTSGLNTNYVQQNGNLGLLYSNTINGGRLSYYHRVDLSVRKRFTFSENSTLEATAAVTNATNRSNIFYVDRITNERVYQLPLFPSLAVAFNF